MVPEPGTSGARCPVTRNSGARCPVTRCCGAWYLGTRNCGAQYPIYRESAFGSGRGVTLAQLVKASVCQADVQRFQPHLGHYCLSCGVFLVKSRHFGLPSAQTIRPNWQISLSRWLGRYTNVEYLQSLYLKR